MALMGRKPAAGEGYLADAYHAQMALFTGHFGILFGPDGFSLAPWSPLKGKAVPPGLTYMGRKIESIR